MEITFRLAAEEDYEACRQLYFSQMEKTIRNLNLVPAAHAAGFRERWIASQVRIIQLDGHDVGWLQVIDRFRDLFLAQLFIEPEFQNRGIGAAAMRRIMHHAAEKRLPLALAVVKGNPAIRLCTRLGFSVTHEDEFKLYMRLGPSSRAANY